MLIKHSWLQRSCLGESTAVLCLHIFAVHQKIYDGSMLYKFATWLILLMYFLPFVSISQPKACDFFVYTSKHIVSYMSQICFCGKWISIIIIYIKHRIYLHSSLCGILFTLTKTVLSEIRWVNAQYIMIMMIINI